jgi:hypothetical protein
VISLDSLCASGGNGSTTQQAGSAAAIGNLGISRGTPNDD